ncbi:MAG: ABC transporter ATP-binding protein [Alicyclobacillaceae bacterium]|nr:ABC transporter ATP-binding protein [Alicyclobacillaceae bacterium]
MSVVEVNGVSWWRDGRAILRHVDWRVETGEHWAVLGENGSGKTSLLNVIAGYVWPTSGRVQVLGEVFGRCDLRVLRQRIGWVSPDLARRFVDSRPHDTALEVVISGRFASVGVFEPVDGEMEAAARQRLRAFDCEWLADRPFRVLSQGEQQRVLLARAWMAEPQLLILDEPCTGLDLAAREKLLRAVSHLGQSGRTGATLLYVTHHVEEILPVFTHVLLLKSGRVVAAGPTRDVLTNGCLSEVFDVPVAVTWRGGRPWITVEA